MSESLADLSDEETYIYLDKDGQVQAKFEVFLFWEDSPSARAMLAVNKNESLEFLSLRIVETMEKFSVFSGLTGLAASNIRKEDGEPMPKRGVVGDWLKAGNAVTFALTSQDLWLSAELRCPAACLAILLDAKVSFSLSVLKFRAQLFEYAMSLLRSRGQEAGYSLGSFRLSRKRTQKSLSVSSTSTDDLVSRRVSLELDDSRLMQDCFDYLSSNVTSTLEPPPCSLTDLASKDEEEVLSPLFPIRKLKIVNLISLEFPRKLPKRPAAVSVQTCKGCVLF